MYYNTHYTMANQMLGKSSVYVVFQHLLDQLAEDKPDNDMIGVSMSALATKTNIDRHTIVKIVKQLEDIGLITVQSNAKAKSDILVNIAQYVAYVTAFMNIDAKQKSAFTKALYAGDLEMLKELGVCVDAAMRDEFLGIKGRYLPAYEKHGEKSPSFENMVKNNQVCHLGENSPCLSAGNLNLGENSPSFANEHINLGYFSPSLDFIKSNLGEISPSLSDDQLRILMQNPQNLVKIYPQLVDPLKNFLFDRFLSKNFAHALQNLVIFHQDLGEISPSLGDSIYNNNIIKENSQIEDLFIKEREGVFEEDEEKFSAGWKKTQESMNRQLQLSKKKANLPYFSQDKILSFIEGCDLDRPDKIFINKLFAICHDHFDMDEQRDEEGNVVYEANRDVNNMAIPRDELKSDYLLRALDETIEACNSQDMEINEDIAASLELIVDWKTQVLGDGEYYIIDTSRMKDVYAEEIPAVSEKHVRGDVQGRQEDKEYMRQIILMGDSDELWQQLTPVELSVYNFLNAHFSIDDEGYIEEPKSDFASKADMDKFWCTGLHSDISHEDFFDVVFNYRSDVYERLTLRPRMFDSRKIRRWNTMHGFESKIS